MKNDSYQLPDELVPEQYFCAKVFIPDRPEYRRAFLGAYFYLSKWVAWERDRENSGSIAASVWREAVDMTMDEWENGCGMTMTCEEIQACIDGIDLTGLVQITNNISCGGDSFITIDNPGQEPVINPPPLGTEPQEPVITPPDGVVIPTEPVDFGSQEPPDGFATWDEYDSGACQAANALVEFAYQTAVRMALFTSAESSVLAKIVVFVSSVFAGVWSGFFVPAMVIKLAEHLFSLAKVEDVGLLFTSVASYISANRQELVCSLYANRADSSGWENWLVDKLASATAGSLSSANSASSWLLSLTWLIPSNLGSQMLFGGNSYNVASPLPCDCVQNDGVWEFVLSGDTQVVNEGWNTPYRLSFDALCERNSQFSSGYLRAKLNLDPEIQSSSNVTITVLVDERSIGMSGVGIFLTSGVGVDEGSMVLSLGENVMTVDAKVNQIEIKSTVSRFEAGVQSFVFDMILDYQLVGE